MQTGIIFCTTLSPSPTPRTFHHSLSQNLNFCFYMYFIYFFFPFSFFIKLYKNKSNSQELLGVYAGHGWLKFYIGYCRKGRTGICAEQMNLKKSRNIYFSTESLEKACAWYLQTQYFYLTTSVILKQYKVLSEAMNKQKEHYYTT